MKRILSILLLSLVASVRYPSRDEHPTVTIPPASLKQWLNYQESPLNSWYQKYVNANGLPVIASATVKDSSLWQVRYIVNTMLYRVPEALDEMLKCHFRIGVVGHKENITHLPECKMMTEWWPDTDWDARGRGYGATLAIPVMSIGEENVVKIPNSVDRYKGESIMVHEFAHNVDFALRRINPAFEAKLLESYEKARHRGLWANTYAMTNSEEYWAEGSQAWFNSCNIEVPKIDSTGSFRLKTREQLKVYHFDLYSLLSTVYPSIELQGYNFDY